MTYTIVLLTVPVAGRAEIGDKFVAKTIDNTIWQGGESSPSQTQNTETSRGIKGGQLEMALTTFGATSSDSSNNGGHTRVRLRNPGGLTTLQVNVKVKEAVAEGCPANTTTGTRPTCADRGQLLQRWL